jgi:hypothetical protein
VIFFFNHYTIQAATSFYWTEILLVGMHALSKYHSRSCLFSQPTYHLCKTNIYAFLIRATKIWMGAFWHIFFCLRRFNQKQHQIFWRKNVFWYINKNVFLISFSIFRWCLFKFTVFFFLVTIFSCYCPLVYFVFDQAPSMKIKSVTWFNFDHYISEQVSLGKYFVFRQFVFGEFRNWRKHNFLRCSTENIRVLG